MFPILRFENFATARYLAFTCGSFQRMAHYLFGTAIELSYKQICNELKKQGVSFTASENSLINSSHSLQRLHQLCCDKGRLQNIKDYETFLLYADILFKTRYPTQLKESNEELSKTFKNLSFSAQNVFPFDDLMAQIDDDIVDLTQHHFNSITFLAIDHTNTHHSNSFFHCNKEFYERIDNYTKYLNPNRPQNFDSINLINTNKAKLLKSETVYLSVNANDCETPNLKSFKLKYGS